MAKAAEPAPADLDAALDPIADELYSVRPDQFAATRDEHIQAARASGQAALARELAKLRKPTQSAWLINLLWRDQHEIIEQLFELAHELTAAQEQAAGAELRALTSQRRQLEVALIRRAHDLARAAGVDVSAAMEREAQETLAAALADPEVADQVRTGRLVKAASYAGFGGGVAVSAPARSAPATPAPRPRVPAGQPIELEAAKRAREQRAAERAAATERVRAARIALAEAAALLKDRTRQQADAEQRRADAQHEVDELTGRLAAAQRALTSAEETAASATAEFERAEDGQRVAEERLTDAQSQLDALSG